MLKFECKMRCRHCKEKFTPKFFNQKFHLDKLECIAAFNEWVKVETEKKNDREWRKEKKVIKEKYKSFLHSPRSRITREISSSQDYQTKYVLRQKIEKQPSVISNN